MSPSVPPFSSAIPLSQVLDFLLPDSLSLLRLVIHNELGILIEDWVLPLSQGHKVIQHTLRVDVCRGALHEMVGLLHHDIDVQVVPVMEEVLEQNVILLNVQTFTERKLGSLWLNFPQICSSG